MGRRHGSDIPVCDDADLDAALETTDDALEAVDGPLVGPVPPPPPSASSRTTIPPHPAPARSTTNGAEALTRARSIRST